jgi:hypothetical protein
MANIKELAIELHNEYERLAKIYRWQTQPRCKVEFDDLPKRNKAVMLGIADFIITKEKKKQKEVLDYLGEWNNLYRLPYPKVMKSEIKKIFEREK